MRSLMPNNHNTIRVHNIDSRKTLYQQAASQLYTPDRKPPRTIDAFLDMLREFNITRIQCAGWHMPMQEANPLLSALVSERITLAITQES
ncbi:hypothetical protein LJT91_07625 [Corynebacterium pseudotuberculosis]|nr:hypothetical protein [Corynebacterium pseudotuberculosis]WAF29550.1 hypothetical protein LJT91_07625 [Corynebacterium pseudotuberculosis]